MKFTVVNGMEMIRLWNGNDKTMLSSSYQSLATGFEWKTIEVY